MPLTIARAQPADLPEIVRLNGVVQDLHAQLRPDLFRSDLDSAVLEDVWLNRLGEQNNDVAIAALDGKVVGYICFERQNRLQDSLHPPRRRLYVHHIVVDEYARRSGIGARLMKYAEAEAKRLSISTVVLDAWASNVAAHVFFRSRGYDPLNIVLSKTVEPH